MRPFAYARAETLDQAVAAAGEPGTALLAGGTELINWMRLGVVAPERVVDVSRLPGLDAIEPLPGGGLRIGALARLNDVAGDPRVAAEWPVLAEAIHRAASAQLRNLATLGGNLLQRTRCPYFRAEEPVPCNRREPGSGCAARAGHSDRHALFGWTDDCGATHPADPPVALAALDAEVVTRTAGGDDRRIPMTELLVVPAERVEADSVLAPGEIIEAIEIAAPAPRSAYIKVRERASYEYALVSAAAALDLAGDGTIAAARVALGSVALRPWRLEAAEARLSGLRPDGDEAAEALRDALGDARPFGQSGYKVRLAAAAARRALVTAAGVAP
jgi:xanthine dehydrogenase YagS FAD-binding subunit